jgi:hypothetical protein
MGQLGGDLDFQQKPLNPDRVGNLGTENLDGDGAVLLEILGEEDCGHPAAAELALDRVSIGEDSLQPLA